MKGLLIGNLYNRPIICYNVQVIESSDNLSVNFFYWDNVNVEVEIVKSTESLEDYYVPYLTNF